MGESKLASKRDQKEQVWGKKAKREKFEGKRDEREEEREREQYQ